jgi:hypothetical protein
MNELLDEEYVTWLYCQVGNANLKNPRRTYWSLFRQLFMKEFVWHIPNDDNRVEDGRQLRHEFLEETDRRDYDWADDPGCSFLEMLIALSRRLTLEADGEPADWFWHLLNNIGLRECNDASRYSEEAADEVLNTVIYRNYDSDGHGGLFPLRSPGGDQRRVELWYQMNAYVLEQI